jgi:FHS family L-fucose permease-like MFS transporter
MNTTKNNYGPLTIIGILFFVFGFITWVNAVLIPFFQKAFDLNNTAAYLVTFAFYISYTIMAIPSTWVLKKVGFKRGMSVGLFVMALGAIIFVPAAKAESYELFLVGLFVIATGLTVLQTASNPYVTILGPIESAAQRISVMGIANKVAGIIGQKVLGGILLVGGSADKRSAAGKGHLTLHHYFCGATDSSGSGLVNEGFT